MQLCHKVSAVGTRVLASLSTEKRASSFHRIIEPITSRCSKFRFKPLDQANTKTRLEYICQQEGIHYAEGSLDSLIKVSEGDLRRAITYLQSASKLHASADDPVTPRSIHEIAGIVPDSTLARLVEALGVELTTTTGDDDAEMLDAKEVKLNTAKNGTKGGFARVKTQVERIVRDGYSAWQILSQVSFPSELQKGTKCMSDFYVLHLAS